MRITLSICLLSLLWASCQAPKSNRSIQVTILHINDVYEIEGVNKRTEGGFARFATLYDSIKAENPNTFSVHAGDFLSPSLIGNLKDTNGTKIKGRHMVDVMNYSRIDYATFGNHEFDLKRNAVLNRIEESEFQYFTSNVYYKPDSLQIIPFEQFERPIPKAIVLPFVQRGDSFRLGLIAVTLPFNQKDYVYYEDVELAIEQVLDTIQADQVVLLSHLNREQDQEIARRFTSIPLIMGGHDHYHFMDTVDGRYVAKADANLRTAWRHDLDYDFETNELKVTSKLIAVDESIAENQDVLERVNLWVSFAEKQVGSLGFDLNREIWKGKEIWECRETVIRSEQSNFGQLLSAAIQNASNTDVALINSGSMRYDDQLSQQLTEGDILKTLPFGGKIGMASVNGEVLRSILTLGLDSNKGRGGYLQINGLGVGEEGYTLHGKAIDANQTYRISSPQFMASGRESKLEIMKTLEWQFPDSINGIENDIRKLFIQYIENQTSGQ